MRALLHRLLLAGLLMAAGWVQAQDFVRIGVLSFESKPDTATRWQPTGNYLQQVLPKYRFSFVPLNYDELNAAVKAGEVDYVFTNPEHYVVLRNVYRVSPLVTLNASIGGHEVNSFGGVLFTRTDHPAVRETKDVHHKRIAAVALYSLGGFLAVADMLRNQHIDVQSSDVASLTFTGTPHSRVVQEVLAGRADAGIVRTGVLEQMAAQGKLDLQSVRVLNQQEPDRYPQLLSSELFPEWPLAAMPHAPAALSKAMVIALMQIQPDTSYAHAGNYASFSPPANYAPVEELMRRLHVYPDVENLPLWKEIWLEKSEQIELAGFIALVLVVGVCVYLFVINRRLHKVTALYRSSQSKLEVTSAAFDSQVCIIVTDAATRIVRANPAFCKLFGYDEADLLGQQTSMLRSVSIPQGQLQEVWKQLQAQARWQGEIECRSREGTGIPCIVTITAINKEAHHVTGYVGSFLDISAQKQTEAHIRMLAHFDPLTEMPNRRLFLERLQAALHMAAKSTMVGAVYFIDLDDFKALNDTHGHAVGDQLLRQIPRRLAALNLPNAFTARLGGDEFVVMLTDLADTPTQAQELAEGFAWKIRETLLLPYVLARRLTGEPTDPSFEPNDPNQSALMYHIAASIGVATFGDQQASVTDVLKRADVAMYQAKQAGKNTVRLFDSHALDSIHLRGQLSTELSTALVKNQLALHYQMQVDADGIPVGAEVLLRWNHPSRGSISPAEFIALAESSGAIVDIGDWVITQACMTLAQWSKRPDRRDLTISVNVSPRQFIEPDFNLKLVRALQSTGAPANRLLLEITEGIVLQSADQVIEKMHKLNGMGIRFSIDDFGTGYSSLSYLHRMPLCEIKIDKAFINELPHDSASESIVRAIIALGASMHMTVLAEGIETAEQQAQLVSLGCQHMQGYLFARPVPLESLETRLNVGAATGQ